MKKILFAIIFTFSAMGNPWESSIVSFENHDRQYGYKKGVNLFVGSSTIRLWNMNLFPNKEIINRGFGGSQVADLLHFYDRIIAKYSPKHVVLYSGENDLSYGKPVWEVYNDFKKLLDKILEDKKTRLTWILVKKSPARSKLNDKINLINSLIYKDYFGHENVDIINMNTLLNLHSYRKDYFRTDLLHLNDKGYSILSKKIRFL